jgi:hypothetical protein
MSLPPRFLIYFGNRSTYKDPFANYVLLDTVHHPNNIWELRVVPPSAAPTILVGNVNTGTLPGKLLAFRHANDPAIVKSHFIYAMATKAVIEATNDPVPVYKLPKYKNVIPMYQKRNVHIKSLPGTPHGPQTGWIDASGGHYTPTPTPPTTSPSTWMDASGGHYISHEYNAPARPAPRIVDPFVARQLLELAQLKHEICPITAEEYITGQTAVMPCGHLFMRMAIEETFKKEANKCPACRQPGFPQFV